MRTLLLVVCSVAVAIGGYLIVLKPSAKDQLTTHLNDALGADSTISLDACDLSIIVETEGDESAAIGLTRVVVQANLRDYNFNTVHFQPGQKRFGLRIDRAAFNEDMLAKAENVVAVGGETTAQLVSQMNSIRTLLEAENGALFFRVMAEVTTSEDGTQKLVAHEDAPGFFQFARAVEALPAPASFRSTTTFAHGEVGAETILTGEVAVIPPLQFWMNSLEDAKDLAHAFHDYAKARGCM